MVVYYVYGYTVFEIYPSSCISKVRIHKCVKIWKWIQLSKHVYFLYFGGAVRCTQPIKELVLCMKFSTTINTFASPSLYEVCSKHMHNDAHG